MSERTKSGRQEWCKEIDCPMYRGQCQLNMAISDNYRKNRRKEMIKMIADMVSGGDGQKVIDWCERESDLGIHL